MSNVIDDVILSAQKTPNGVVIQLTIDTFRRLISALNYNGGAWIATDNQPDSVASTNPQNEPHSEDKQTDSDDQTEPVQDGESPDESTKRRRAKNQKITAKDADRLYRLAATHPDWTLNQLVSAAQMLPFTLYNPNHRFDIFGDGVERTLRELIRIGRAVGNDTINRFGDETYDETDVAQMGISSRYQLEE